MDIRTAMYVFEPSTVTIRASDPSEDRVTLCRFNRKGEEVALGARALQPGVYMIVSHHPVQVSGGHISVVPLAGDKDEPPEPKAQVFQLEGCASPAAIQRFFNIFKGIDVVGDSPAAADAAAPGPATTARIKDDPDGIDGGPAGRADATGARPVRCQPTSRSCAASCSPRSARRPTASR